MSWVEVFVVFFVSHEVGDYLFQTEWQAMHKRGGLSCPGVRRRALLLHIATYTLAFVPALIWLAGSISWGGALGVAALIAIPHLIQDDGRLLTEYGRLVKKADLDANPSLGAALDQAFHFLTLFLTALLVGH
ncbi:MAG: DUF3307 domain-containing protein [Solirubrobacterales bacterium]|nr:DUF3307 domain-containing protein [Solirubrobacterales bacterium]